MFDLPTLTKKQRHAHTVFRNYLLNQGFLRCQLSVYMRVLPSKNAVKTLIRRIRDNRPNRGKVTMVTITDKQYEGIITFEDKLERREKNPEQLRLF